MDNQKPLTGYERFLKAAAEQAAPEMKPVTRREQVLDSLAKGEPFTDPHTREEFFLAKLSDAMQGGGGVGDPLYGGVIFVDYDGTVIETFTTDEFMTQTAMPSNPNHHADRVPLRSLGWNWSLADLKSELTTYPSACITVGQMYRPVDGKTHIIFSQSPKNTAGNGLRIRLEYVQTVGGGSIIDWGDGTAPYVPESSNVYTEHTYEVAGSYDITISITSGKISSLGRSDAVSNMFDSGTWAANPSYSAVKLVVVGDNVDELGQSAFMECAGLDGIVISHGVTKINGSCFSNCRGLPAVVVPSSCTIIGTNFCTSCRSMKYVSIPNSILSFGGNAAFSSCSTLVTAFVPSSVSSPVVPMFYDCRSLRSFVILNGATTVPNNGFCNCSMLDHVEIPNTVTTLGSASFQASAVTSIDLPTSVTELGNSCFRECSRLTHISIPDSVTSIGTFCFYLCYALESVTMSNSVTALNASTFEGCQALRDVSLPVNLTSIGGSAFSGCISLIVPSLPDTLKTIGSNAFASCRLTTIVHIPASVTSIGASAFSSEPALLEVHALPTTPPTLNSNAFTRNTGLTVYVPRSEGQSVLTAYSAVTNWAKYTLAEEPET